MTFSVAYSSFSCLPSDVWMGAGGTSSTITTCIPSDVSDGLSAPMVTVDKSDPDSEGSISGQKSELASLDLFSGCGAMSTGLCLGANLAGVNLKTVRNEKAEDFWLLYVNGRCYVKDTAWRMKVLPPWMILMMRESLRNNRKCQKENLKLVRWKGYGPYEDTWETPDGLRQSSFPVCSVFKDS